LLHTVPGHHELSPPQAAASTATITDANDRNRRVVFCNCFNFCDSVLYPCRPSIARKGRDMGARLLKSADQIQKVRGLAEPLRSSIKKRFL